MGWVELKCNDQNNPQKRLQYTVLRTYRLNGTTRERYLKLCMIEEIGEGQEKWLDGIKEDVESLNMTIQKATSTAQDRATWRSIQSICIKSI